MGNLTFEYKSVCLQFILTDYSRFHFVYLRFKLQLPRQLENCTISQYSPPNIPREGEEVFVVVCHINSPSDFYLRLVSLEIRPV